MLIVVLFFSVMDRQDQITPEIYFVLITRRKCNKGPTGYFFPANIREAISFFLRDVVTWRWQEFKINIKVKKGGKHTSYNNSLFNFYNLSYWKRSKTQLQAAPTIMWTLGNTQEKFYQMYQNEKMLDVFPCLVKSVFLFFFVLLKSDIFCFRMVWNTIFFNLSTHFVS